MPASCAVRLDRAVGHDGGGDADGEALVAVLLQHPDQLDLAVAVHDVGRRPLLGRGPSACRAGRRGGRRTLARPRRAAARRRRGRTGRRRLASVWRSVMTVSRWSNRACRRVTRSPNGARTSRRGRQRRRVPVDPDQEQVGPGLEQQPGVAAAADRGIHQHTRWARAGRSRRSGRPSPAGGGTRSWTGIPLRLLRSPRTRRPREFAHLQPPGRRLPPGFLPD